MPRGRDMNQQPNYRNPPVCRRNQTPDTTAPDGTEIRVLIDQRHQAGQASLCEVTLPAGQVSRPMWHRTVEEIWYVLSGTGRVWRSPVDPGGGGTGAGAPGEVVDVKPGDALTVPTGWRFQFSAGTGADLKFLCHTSPPWPGPSEAVLAASGGLGQATV